MWINGLEGEGEEEKKGVNGVVPGNHLQWQYTMEGVGGCGRGRQSTFVRKYAHKLTLNLH